VEFSPRLPAEVVMSAQPAGERERPDLFQSQRLGVLHLDFHPPRNAPAHAVSGSFVLETTPSFRLILHWTILLQPTASLLWYTERLIFRWETAQS